MKKQPVIIIIALLFAVIFISNALAEPLPKRLIKDEIAQIMENEPDEDVFRFVVMGDTRDGDTMFEYLISLAADLDPAFIIDVGDLVHSGLEEQYRNYYDIIAKSPVPFVSVIGNHEAVVPGGYDRFIEMFGETDFFFDYAGVRFICLDNSVKHGYGVSGEQLKWLEDALQTENITMVFMHSPPNMRNWQHGMDTAKNSNEFVELVERYKVKKVYFGHMHAYDRLRRGDTEYVMTGCAGAEPDPVSGLYDRLGGGYYHFLLVEVRGGKVMDVLVEPITSNLIDFPLPDGRALEFPFASYRHFNTPVVESLEADEPANAGTPASVTVNAHSSPDALEVGLKGLEMDCLDSKGEWHENIGLKSGYFDERVWKGDIPAMPAGTAKCFFKATDALNAVYMNVPPRDSNPPDATVPGPGGVSYIPLGADLDDSSLRLPDEFDILGSGIAYDDEYFYFYMDVQGGFLGGNKTPPRRLNIYGFAVIRDDIVIEADPKKLLGQIPILVYGPYATSMGFPKCGVYDLSGFREGKADVSKKGIKCKVEGNRLHIRVERSLYPEDMTGARFLTAAAAFILEPKPDVFLGDIADIVHLKLEGVPFKVE